MFAEKAPDLVVSGINPGGNFGNVSNHSGTVGAAATAIANGVPGIAVSIEHDPVDAGKGFAAELAARLTYAGNTAAAPDGAQLTRIGTGSAVVLHYRPNASGSYDIAAGMCGAPTPCAPETRRDADTTALERNRISISPLDADWSTEAPRDLQRRLRTVVN